MVYSRINSFVFLTLTSLLIVSPHAVNAATLHVPAQYPTIQAAINQAVQSDTILVANGIYTGVGNYNIDFGGKNVTVKSSGGAANCVIDCQQAGRAFVLQSGENGGCRIEGFTIKNGKAKGNGGGIYVGDTSRLDIAHCILTDNFATGRGGAMYRGNAENCVFRKNSAPEGEGGAIYYASGGGSATNCTFVSNTALKGGGIHGGSAFQSTFTDNTSTIIDDGISPVNGGGGMSEGTAVDCTFTTNKAVSGGGAMTGTARGCTFINNRASTGGAMFGQSNLSFARECIFKGNSAVSGGGAYKVEATACIFLSNRAAVTKGGGLLSGDAINCVFWGNSAKGNGGGVADSHLLYCTVSGNTAEGSFGGGVYNSSGTSTDPIKITNSIVWGNTSAASSPNVKNDGGTLTVAYSNVGGGFAGTGNINADPLFAEAVSGDLHLTVGSPCINTGTTDGFTPPARDCNNGLRSLGTASDMGAYEHGNFNIAAHMAAVRDFDGDRRPDFLTTMDGKPAYGYTMSGVNSAPISQFGITPLVPTGGWRVVGAGKFDLNSSTPSLVLTHPTDQRIHFWHLNGTTRTGGEYAYYTTNRNQHITLPPGAYLLGAADFDRDGRDDLAWFDPTTRRIGIWQMRGASFYSGAYLNVTLPAGWSIVGMGKLDYNPYPELVLLSPSREIGIWYLNGFNWYSGSYVLHPADFSRMILPAGWRVVGLADFNQDNLDELVIQNRAENKIEYWNLSYNLNFLGRGLIYLQ